MDAEVMLRQARAIGDDIRRLAEPVDEQVSAVLAQRWQRLVTRIRVVGCGDSLHAGLAAGWAFAAVPGVDYAAVPAFEYSAYPPAPWPPSTGRELVVAVSASGGTPSAIDAVRTATARGAETIAVVGRAGSPLAAAAGHCIVVPLPDAEPSPGIRTFNASLVALLLLARCLTAARGRGRGLARIWEGSPAIRDDAVVARRAELSGVADVVDATNDALAGRTAAVQEALADADALVVLGSGPSYGTARHAAAKLVEGAGILAHAQDIEEWRHVERFAIPADLPLIVVAPAGHSAERAARTATSAGALGRRVVVVAPEDPADATRLALPVVGTVGEALSPLAYQLFAPHLAACWADRLGRVPFRRGQPGFHPGPGAADTRSPGTGAADTRTPGA